MEWAVKQTNIGSVLILLIALDAGSHSQKSRETDFRLHVAEGIGRMQESRFGQRTSLLYKSSRNDESVQRHGKG